MLTTSFISLRRFAGSVLTVVLSSVVVCANVAAQTPLVVSSSATAIPHTGPYGAPWQSAVSNRGDFVLFDFKTGGMYIFPANGGPQITFAPGVLTGGFTDSGIAIDPRNNNIYLNNNYNGGLMELPFDVATGTWDLPPQTVASGLAGNLGGTCGNYFQSAGMSMNDNGILAVATENGCGVEIFTVPVDASGNFGAATPIVSNMKARAKTVTIDDAGNISYVGDAGYPGVLFIPAGTTGLADDSKVLAFFNTPTVSDSTGKVTVLGNSVQGTTVDTNGNLYVADANLGMFFVPLESGTPNPAHAILLSPVLGSGGPSIDPARGVLFTPTSGYNKIFDVIKITVNRTELGSSVVATPAPQATVTYYFSGTVTPDSFVIRQDGTPGDFAFATDLTGCGITTGVDSTGKATKTTTAYKSGGTCALPISFTPHSVGDISATLVMLDATGNIINTTVLHGVGLGSQIVMAPATESAIGSAFKTPSQIATDALGSIYIADSGLGKVLVYPKGSGPKTVAVSVGTGLVAPTGVAVDGAGNLFIADSGKLIEVPYGPTGLNAAGQITLKSGLGTNLKLAADGLGDVFVADPDNQRVVRLRNLINGPDAISITGFSQLSAIAADGGGDLFVANGVNLVEFSSVDAFTTVSSSLTPGTSGLAVDASGAVYATSSTGTIRIPNEAGTLNISDRITLAKGVTKPTSVAVDSLGNAYVTDGTAENVDYVNANGFLNLGTLTTPTSTQTANATIVNDGNVPLNISGFSSTLDFSQTATGCPSKPIAVGLSCTAGVTFNPGPGDQGILSGLLLVKSDAVNSPIGINVTGVGATLAASTSTITVTKPTVTSAPVIITVASTSGTGPVPTGNVTLTVTTAGFAPVVITQPLKNGTVTINETNIMAASDTFTVNYIGDRVYGTSTAATTVTVGTGTISLLQPVASSVPTYVLAAGTGSQEPYDNSQVPFYYNYPVTVLTANGAPLVGVPIFNAAGTQIGVDYGYVTYLLANGTAACPPVKVNADGTAPLGTQCFTINTSNNQIPALITSYTVTPVYTGNTDPNYATITGTPITFIALRNSAVTIVANPNPLNVAVGSTATANLTLTSLLGYGTAGATGSLNNYSLPLELECDNLPAHASCTFTYPTPDPSDPQSVAVTTTTPGKVVLTINTNVAVGTSTASLRQSPVVFAAMFGFSLLGLAFGRKKALRASLFGVLSLLLFCGVVAGLSACSTAQIGAAPILTTPKGTYAVTVTAKQVGSKIVPGSTVGTTVNVQGNGNIMSLPYTVSLVVQ